VTVSAAGRVLIDGRDTGSGFAITGLCALTAGHVVRTVTEKMPRGQRLPVAESADPTVVCVCDSGEPSPVRAVVKYQPEGAEPIPVTQIEVNTSLDVAVLHLQRSAPAVLPVGPVKAGSEWRVETRPKASDPTLTGTVTDPHRRLQNQCGEETTLIQLWVREELGDYQGYLGSPVTSPSAGGIPTRVLGVLVEQGRWRISPQLGQPAPVANVLFAAPIDQVLTDAAGLAAGLVAGFVRGQASGIAAGLTFGIAGGIADNFDFDGRSSAWTRYYISVMINAVRQRSPLRFGTFLDWAHQAGLLRVSGIAYQFTHRQLQDWLTSPETRSPHPDIT
jgi:hypothetical protein